MSTRRLAVGLVAVLLVLGQAPAASAAPAVQIVAPAAGATVAGRITLDATAPGARRVEYLVDGHRVARDASCCDWSERWNSRRVNDGPHTLTVRARDRHGKTGTATVAFTVDNVADPAPPIDQPPPPPGPITPPAAFPSCDGPGRTVVHPYPSGTVLSSRWQAPSPPADTTYDLTGVTSTAFPSSQYPFSAGTSTPARRTCIVGGELRGTIDTAQSWEHYHDKANAACVKLVALDWSQILGTRCDGVEDGFRPQEGGSNLNRTRFYIAGTHLSTVADDCLENDYTLGGVLYDNLWESCFTGISERPSSSNGSWRSPPGETLVVDHLLMGLRPMPHDSSKGTGPNSLFKWSTSGNQVVIRCSTFYVPQRSVNGSDSMALPPGTVVDDTACPTRPSTIVWTGGGPYPGDLRGTGIRVTSDRSVWDTAVAAWKASH